MKRIVLLIVLLALTGCEKWQTTDTGATYRVHVIDGCEYIEKYGGDTYTHKANCTNLIHKNLSAEAH